MVAETWPYSIREDFPALKNRLNGKPPIYLDNACTTLVPTPVIEAMNEYYCGFPSCGGGRSRHWFATEVNNRIEGNPENEIKGSRQIIQEFLNARSAAEIIFTLNASHAINIVALGFPFRPGDVVLLTDQEHNSNLVPWLRLQKKGLIRVDHVDSDPDDRFDLVAFERRMRHSKVRLVSMVYTSNVTGYTIPAKQIIEIAHTYGARVLLDAAQAVPHRTIDVQELEIDFLAFSLHKMCGPKGIGVLYGKEELFGQKRHEEDESGDIIEPVMLGGGAVSDSTYGSYDLPRPPDRFEAGIQNYPAQIGAGAAVRYLQQIGLGRIHDYVNRLNCFLTEELLKRYGDTGWFRILGPSDAGEREGILTFEVRRPNSVGIVEELSEKNNLMVRDGAFCAHSYLNSQFGQGWTRPSLPAEHRMTYRISLYFYNTFEECHIFLETLNEIFQERSYL